MSAGLERYKPLLWLGAIVLAGVALIAVVRSGAGHSEATPSVAADAAPTPDTAIPAAPAGVQDTPPWLTAPAATRATGTRVPAADGRAVPTPEQTTRAVVQLREQAIRNERTADELLKQIDALKASGQAPQGVDLDALRTNLTVTKRAQVLARELAELTQQPSGPQRQQRILAITGELQQLQSQLRYDAARPGAAPLPLPQAMPAAPGRTP